MHTHTKNTRITATSIIHLPPLLTYMYMQTNILKPNLIKIILFLQKTLKYNTDIYCIAVIVMHAHLIIIMLQIRTLLKQTPHHIKYSSPTYYVKNNAKLIRNLTGNR